jgi:hypothetical protein
MLEQISTLPDNVVGFVAKDEVTSDDYQQRLVPAIEPALAAHDKIRRLYDPGDDFTGYTGGGPLPVSSLSLHDRHHALPYSRFGNSASKACDLPQPSRPLADQCLGFLPRYQEGSANRFGRATRKCKGRVSGAVSPLAKEILRCRCRAQRSLSAAALCHEVGDAGDNLGIVCRSPVRQAADGEQFGPGGIGYHLFRVAEWHALVVDGVDHQEVYVQRRQFGTQVEVGARSTDPFLVGRLGCGGDISRVSKAIGDAQPSIGGAKGWSDEDGPLHCESFS